MQILHTHLTLVLDTRRKKKSGMYPVKLRLTHARTAKFFATGVDLSEQDYALLQDSKQLRQQPITKRRELQDIGLRLDALLLKGHEVLKAMRSFSFAAFEREMLPKPAKAASLYALYEEKIGQLKAEGRIGTASNYSCGLVSLKRFAPKLRFEDLDPAFLHKYERWLLAQGRSITTVGIYLRPLRALLNEAISLGLLSPEQYPFGKRKYQIPASRNIKKALSLEEIALLYRQPVPTGTWLERAKDLWFFSYFAHGMNMLDMARLKPENLDGEYLSFVRSKTKRTLRTDSRPISIYLSPELQDILQRYHRPNAPYLFPILQEGISPAEEKRLVAQWVQNVNKNIQRIADAAGINKKVRTYAARHSFATILKRSGTPTEVISEALGHSNLATTNSYLDSFEDETKKQISRVLVPK